MVADVQIAHSVDKAGADKSPGGNGRTVIIVTLSGGDVAAREALGERVMAATREALAAKPAVNRLAAVFSRLSQSPRPVPALPPVPVRPIMPVAPDSAPPEIIRAGMVLPAEVPPPPISPYEAPFLLAPLRRPTS